MNENKSNSYKKIIGLIIGIGAFITLLVGITYAYLQAMSSSDISGVAASTDLKVNVVNSVNGGDLIPMDDSDLGSAISYTTPCIDKNGFGSCKLYTVTVTNNSDIDLTVNSNIQFTKTGSLDNLKWQELTSLTSIGTITGATNGSSATLASTSSTNWRSGDTITAGTSRTYYIAVWISNVTSDQTTTDNGSYTANITFNVGDGSGVSGKLFDFATDSWEEIATNVASDPSIYSVGNTKCIALDGFTTTNDNGCDNGEFLVRIANNTTPSDCDADGYSETACGFVIEFVDIISTRNMNPSTTDNEYGTNIGSWPATSMRTYVNEDIYNALPSELSSLIINTSVVSGYGSSDSSNYTSTDKIYLLSPKEVWNVTSYDTAASSTRQLDYYSGLVVTTSNYSGAIKYLNGTATWWFLRTPYSGYDAIFFYVDYDGDRNGSAASNNFGVSPAFRIGS